MSAESKVKLLSHTDATGLTADGNALTEQSRRSVFMAATTEVAIEDVRDFQNHTFLQPIKSPESSRNPTWIILTVFAKLHLLLLPFTG